MKSTHTQCVLESVDGDFMNIKNQSNHNNKMDNKITYGIGGIVIGLVLASLFSSMMFPGFRAGGGE